MIENLKDLERLLKLCRKQGVTEIKLNDVEFKLGEMPMDNGTVQTELIDTIDPLTGGNFGDPLTNPMAFYSVAENGQ
jgi:hypothetical protein